MKTDSQGHPANLLAKELARCVRCGACLSYCPVYREVRREWAVARGRLALLEATGRGWLRPDKKLQRVLSSCLLCGACREGCPNEVDTPLLVRAGRRQLAEGGKAGGRLWRAALRHLLSPRRLPRLVRAARALKTLWAAGVPRESGLQLRLLRPEGRRIWMPRLAERFLDDWPLPRAPARVTVFPGCVERFMRPESVLAEVRLLERQGEGVSVPEGLGCCGLAAWSAGEVKTARKLFLHNLERLLPEGGRWPEVVTSACASCAYLLSRGEDLFPEAEQPLREKLKELSRRVVPFSALFGRRLEEPAGRAGGVRLTWHDPCHLARGFSEREFPRRILRSLAGAEYVELADAGECCGGGGLFSVLHPRLAEKIGERKRQQIVASGASVVVTECSGCVLQLEKLLRSARVAVLTLPQAMEKFTVFRC